jgi:hypothetical protein
VKCHIGNAFPPSVVKVLYDHIKEHLRREDGHGFTGLLTPPSERLSFADAENARAPKRGAAAVEVDDVEMNELDVVLANGVPVARRLFSSPSFLQQPPKRQRTCERQPQSQHQIQQRVQQPDVIMTDGRPVTVTFAQLRAQDKPRECATKCPLSID